MKPITTLCLFLGTCLIAGAEGKPDHPGKKPHHKGPPPEMMKKFDTNGDGTLSPEEKQAMREAMDDRYKEKVKEFDADGDGKLSDAEREKMREAHKAEWQKKFDTDGDGKLSEEEREKMREFHRDKGGKHREGKGPEGKRPEGKCDDKPAPPPTAVE